MPGGRWPWPRAQARRPAVREAHGRGTEQADDEIGHGLALEGNATNVPAIHGRASAKFTMGSRWRPQIGSRDRRRTRRRTHPRRTHVKDQIRIELTRARRTQVRKATGKDAEAVELSVEELEERIAPAKVFPPRA